MAASPEESRDDRDASEPAASVRPAAAPRNKRLLPLLFVMGGLGLALFLGSKAPKEQHLRLALGPRAVDVTAVEVTVLDASGDVVRATRVPYEAGKAPRIVALDPSIPNGDYLVRLEIATPSGPRVAERRLSLSGGTTSVDLAGVLDENRGAP